MANIHLFPDNIDTDLIIPGQFLSISDATELAAYCMYGYDTNLAAKVVPGDIFIAGTNFGCGSSREHAPVSIKALGVKCIIAKSFARIFYRNAINVGLPVLQCSYAVEDIEANNEVDVDFAAGKIINKTKQKEYNFAPFPASIQRTIEAGGVINSLKKGNP